MRRQILAWIVVIFTANSSVAESDLIGESQNRSWSRGAAGAAIPREDCTECVFDDDKDSFWQTDTQRVGFPGELRADAIATSGFLQPAIVDTISFRGMVEADAIGPNGVLREAELAIEIRKPGKDFETFWTESLSDSGGPQPLIVDSYIEFTDLELLVVDAIRVSARTATSALGIASSTEYLQSYNARLYDIRAIGTYVPEPNANFIILLVSCCLVMRKNRT